MRRSEVLLLAVAAALGFLLYLARRDVLNERLERHNAEAAADSSKLVWRDANRRVTHRLAFQQREAIRLEGELGRVLRARNEETIAFVRLRVELDSLSRVLGAGSVTALDASDSVRQLEARLDSMGFHVSVDARVPRPPGRADVWWTVKRDAVALAVALNRDPDGRVAMRALSGPYATTAIDTVRVQVTQGLRSTHRAASYGLVALLFYAVGRLLH